MKWVFAFALSLATTVALASPARSAAQMTLGVGGGVSAATFTGDDADALGASKGSRVGVNVGAWLQVPVAPHFAIVPGGFYVQKGAEYSEGGTTATFKANYIEFPILVSVALTDPDASLGFNIFAGPTFAFEAGCDLEGSDSGTSASISCDDAGIDERQKFDIGVAGGAGVSFPVSERLSIMLSGGYDLGLRKLDTSSAPEDIKNSAFFGTVGVGIPLG